MCHREADLDADRRDDRGGPKGPRRSILSGVLGKTMLRKAFQPCGTFVFSALCAVRCCSPLAWRRRRANSLRRVVAPPMARRPFPCRTGDSRGHWKGDALVVETTKFRPEETPGPGPGVCASSGTAFSGGPTLDSSATHGNTSRPADWSAAWNGLANLEPSAASRSGVVLGGWIGTAAFGECLLHRSRAREQTGQPVITIMTASLIHLIRLITVLCQLL